MTALDHFSSLVATLYEAAADPAHFARFLQDFHNAMGGTRGALTAVAPSSDVTKVILEGYTGAEIQAYADYYNRHDVVLQAGLQTVRQRAEWIGPLEETIPYRRLEASEIYNDHYRGMDMHYASCIMVGATGPYSALGLAAWRPKSSGPFRKEQLHLAQILAPHLKQAFRLHANIASLQIQNKAFHHALEATAVAVIALRADGRILAASQPALTFLDRKTTLVRRHGKLHALKASTDAVLQQLIRNATRTGELNLADPAADRQPPGGAMLLPQPDVPQALQLQVYPARATGSLDGPAIAALVFVSDPAAVIPSRAKMVEQLYHLTAIEARLTDLFLQGLELKQAAEELRLTYAGTRFHLKQIFRKTNTTRQTELLRLLLTIPA